MSRRGSSSQSPARRNLLKVLAGAGGVAAMAPFVPWGEYLLASIGGAIKEERQRIVMPDTRFANVNNIPVNTNNVFVYPRTGDPKVDAEPFRRFQLLRLSPDLGGDKDEPSAFRAYSMVCVHLWCLWNYYPERRPPGTTALGSIECPCHGSKYLPDTGKAVAGPAALQSPPSNALPRLDVEIDDNGDIWVLPPVWNPKDNGVVGFGRYV